MDEQYGERSTWNWNCTSLSVELCPVCAVPPGTPVRRHLRRLLAVGSWKGRFACILSLLQLRFQLAACG